MDSSYSLYYTQKLRQLSKNNYNRKIISSDELARKAAYVEYLLERLKAKGFEFPEQMSDYDAKACHGSKIKPTMRTLQETATRICYHARWIVRKGKVNDLKKIAEDDQITQEERQEFDAIMAELRQIVQGGLELEVFCSTGKEEG